MAKEWPVVQNCSRMSFAALFLATRVVWWNLRNIAFWRDMFPLMGMGAVEEGGVPVWHMWSWVLANALLTVLQHFWAFKILKMLTKKLSKGDKGKREE